VHCRSWETKTWLHGAITPNGTAEHESPVSVSGVQDAQRLVNPSREVADELGDTGNGCAGVDKSKSVVVSAAAVGEDSAVVAAAEKAPDGDGVVFAPGLADQLVRLALR
jgi:hypothetical protein